MSYFYPLLIRRGQGEHNAYLELLLYRGRVQLATRDALYSDGDRYVPAVMAVKKIKHSLRNVHKVLVLGAGLGSMARVLRSNGCNPAITLVDKDSTVLEWATEFAETGSNIATVHDDARHYMMQCTEQFDLVFIDVFMGRVVPAFVCTEAFLMQCRHCVPSGGYVALNYIVNSEAEWEELRPLFSKIFAKNDLISVGVNKILIGAVI